MKKFSLNLSFWLVTLMSVLAGCSKSEVTPDQPAAAAITQDSYRVKGYIFLREPEPFRLGHTGVGYEVREMSGTTIAKVYTYCGGVEGMNSCPFINVGYPLAENNCANAPLLQLAPPGPVPQNYV